MKTAVKKCAPSLAKSTYVQWEHQKKREIKKQKKIFKEIMAENKVPQFNKKINIHIQEAQRTPTRIMQRPHTDTS